MVKAAALHFVLVIVLVISTLVGSLIYLHYFHKEQQQKFGRWQQLTDNIAAANSLARSNYFPYTRIDSLIASPIYSEDSIRINKNQWGLMDVITLSSWRGRDSLKEAFLAGLQANDSTVLYIADEDRPLSISGKTKVHGNAWLPKSGIKPAFVDGEYYQGPEEMVDGKMGESSSSLPEFNQQRINFLSGLMGTLQTAHMETLPNQSSLKHSFFQPTQYYHWPAGSLSMPDSILGNIIIIADSTIRIPAQVYWEDAIVIAPHIHIADNFRGQGQFFARDSLRLGKDVAMNYPSVLALLVAEDQPYASSLTIGENSTIHGLVLLHAADVEAPLHRIDIGKNTLIQGMLVCAGLLKYTDPIQVYGSTYSQRFITQRPSSLYENYLINITFSHPMRSPYFLRPHLWATDTKRKLGISKWLNY